jgi:hypothetical protein
VYPGTPTVMFVDKAGNELPYPNGYDEVLSILYSDVIILSNDIKSPNDDIFVTFFDKP